jgi:hypothetical protein
MFTSTDSRTAFGSRVSLSWFSKFSKSSRDGDRFHPIEKLSEDIQRQMVLERLGWKFIRIRGTEYFRHGSKTMKRVFDELDSLGIERLGIKEPMEQNSNGIDELQSRVLSRAEEIRAIWESDLDIAEEKLKRSRLNKIAND